MGNNRITRRRLLAGAAAAATIALVRTVTGQTVHAAVGAPADPTKEQGAVPGALGTRSPFEHLAKKPSDTSARSPLQDLYGSITPSDLHFERSHNGVPLIDPTKYKLLMHGMVDRPMAFTLSDLKRFPALSRICFIECSGNFRTGKDTLTPQDVAGLTSQSEWTGVRLSTLFREVGVSPKASWFLAEGSDAAVMTRSIPVEKGWKDAMIVYGQNGEAIRPEQGYPIRLLLPGWEGNTSVKWLRRIELADQPFMTREETSKYTEPIGDGKIRQFSFVMDARSIITFPAYPVNLPKGWVEIRGIAWSGRGKIVRVEVSTDAGKSWHVAQLQEPVLSKAHTVFRLLWRWDGGETEIMSRAIDDTDYIQPAFQQLVAARSRDMGGYHLNPIVAWRIGADGSVWLRPENWK
jgi:sulfane dehydrogenase subunit SoxC